MDPILLSRLAKQLLANPLTRARVIYPVTNRVNYEALRAELARMRFADEGARAMDSHTPSRNSKGKGGPKLKSPSPGARSQDQPTYNWA